MNIRDEADRTTWHLQYLASATEEQRQQGEALKQTYDPETDPIVLAERETTMFSDPAFLHALIRWLAPKVGRTPAQARAEIVALYRPGP